MFRRAFHSLKVAFQQNILRWRWPNNLHIEKGLTFKAYARQVENHIQTLLTGFPLQKVVTQISEYPVLVCAVKKGRLHINVYHGTKEKTLASKPLYNPHRGQDGTFTFAVVDRQYGEGGDVVKVKRTLAADNRNACRGWQYDSGEPLASLVINLGRPDIEYFEEVASTTVPVPDFEKTEIYTTR